MSEDLFKAAGIHHSAKPKKGRKSRTSEKSGGGGVSGDESYGGHNLRAVIAERQDDGISITYRPRSTLATATARKTLAKVLESGAPRKRKNSDDESDSGEEDDGDDDMYEDDDDEEENEENETATPQAQTMSLGKTSPLPTAVVIQKQPSPPAVVIQKQPFDLVTTKDDSRLTTAAIEVFTNPGYSLTSDLLWQSNVRGDATNLKAFRIEVTQQVDVVAFGFMRPASPYVQILHSVATYAVRGGGSDLQGHDFGFVGDRTSLRIPTPVMLDDKAWKWFSKKLGMDVPPIQGYYANTANARRLYYDDASGGTNTTVPRLIYLPPPFLAFCLEQPRTPFELHEFVSRYATRDGSETGVGPCTLVMDWCIVATKTAAATSPTTSLLSLSLPTAPSDDDGFLRWLYKIDRTSVGDTEQNDGVGPGLAAQHHGHPPAATVAPPTSTTTAQVPTPDVWEQMAKNISSSFASAAAAWKPPQTDDADVSYESGGRNYDGFQMAMIKGFAHVPEIAEVPALWALFQYTKHLETHKSNLRRKMAAWAMSDDREYQVPIERSLFIPDATMKEILTLDFNPGGVLAEAEEADLGLSILICRTRTTAAKSAIKKYEKAKDQSKRNRSFAEAEQEQNNSAYDLGALPDDYNELLRCIGTYCALLHSLFGPKCAFYKHCYAIWETMNSDLVYEQRHLFTVLFCRQIVWAFIAESRVYFSQRLTEEDFSGIPPDEIQYPRSQLIAILPNVRDLTPIIRSSFPAAWYPAGHHSATATPPPLRSVAGSGQAPVQAVVAPGGATPTVVSGITTGSTRAARPPVTIRTSDINPKIKAVMEPYIEKHKGVWLSALLTHCNITIEDLPIPASMAAGHTVCYNFILGKCNVDNCQHEHVHANEVTDDFAADLLAKLRPGITEFMANGLPPGTRRRRNRRRPRRE